MIRLGTVIIAAISLVVPAAFAQNDAANPDAKAVAIGRQLAKEAMNSTTDLFGPLSKESRGILIAEGDSWFDYWEPTFLGPRHSDVLKVLDSRGYDVRSVAHFGHTLEGMTYDVGQLAELAREMEKLKVRPTGQPLRAILLSAGGNDIAGDELAMLLNHRRADSGVTDDVIVSEVFDVRLTNAWITFLTSITAMQEQLQGKRVPIFIHGYDFPVPDGRGWLGGSWLLPGPWLGPAFTRKGYGDRDANQKAMAELIGRYSNVIERVIRLKGFEHVYFVRTPGTLRSDASYRDDWANELHPSTAGFRRIADCYERAIEMVERGEAPKVIACTTQ